MRKLTVREEEVVGYLKQGKSNREIGKLMTISEKTVKLYISHINMKLKTKSRLEIVHVTSSDSKDIRLGGFDTLSKNLEELSNTILKQSTRITELEAALAQQQVQTGVLIKKVDQNSLPVGI